jgi:hypothetical protein
MREVRGEGMGDGAAAWSGGADQRAAGRDRAVPAEVGGRRVVDHNRHRVEDAKLRRVRGGGRPGHCAGPCPCCLPGGRGQRRGYSALAARLGEGGGEGEELHPPDEAEREANAPGHHRDQRRLQHLPRARAAVRARPVGHERARAAAAAAARGSPVSEGRKEGRKEGEGAAGVSRKGREGEGEGEGEGR